MQTDEERDAIYDAYIEEGLNPYDPHAARLLRLRAAIDAADTATQAPARAYLCINAWYGRSEQPIEIVKETPRRYLVKILRDGTLVPGGRRLNAGDTLYAPKYAIKFTEAR